MFCKSMPDKQKLNYIVSNEGKLEFRKIRQRRGCQYKIVYWMGIEMLEKVK